MGRKLRTTIKEHESNVKADPSRHSMVTEHAKDFDHKFDWNNVKMLDTEHNYHKRLISEIIHI